MDFISKTSIPAFLIDTYLPKQRQALSPQKIEIIKKSIAKFAELAVISIQRFINADFAPNAIALISVQWRFIVYIANITLFEQIIVN